MDSDKKESILDSAQRLFARFGLQKTTIDEIVRVARVGKGTIYRYFQGKEDIYIEVIDKESEFLREKVLDAVSRENTPQGKLRAFVITKMNCLRQLANLYSVTRENIGEFLPYLPAIETARRRNFDEEKKIIKSILFDGVEKGVFSIRDIDQISLGIISALKGLEYPWIIEDENIGLEDNVDLLMEILFKGIESR